MMNETDKEAKTVPSLPHKTVPQCQKRASERESEDKEVAH